MPPIFGHVARSRPSTSAIASVKAGTVVTRMLVLIAVVRLTPSRNSNWFITTPSIARP